MFFDTPGGITYIPNVYRHGGRIRASPKTRGLGVVLIREEATLDPALNLERDAAYWRNGTGNLAGLAQRPLRGAGEVPPARGGGMSRPGGGDGRAGVQARQRRRRLPRLREHQPLPLLDLGDLAVRGVVESLRALSFPVTRLLESLGVAWGLAPLNNVYVEGRKIYGFAQARRRGRLLHHGTLLVSCDLEAMRVLLKPGGRSHMAPVVNLRGIVPGIAAEEAEGLLAKNLPAAVEI